MNSEGIGQFVASVVSWLAILTLCVLMNAIGGCIRGNEVKDLLWRVEQLEQIDGTPPGITKNKPARVMDLERRVRKLEEQVRP